jgi:hypothetical protein
MKLYTFSWNTYHSTGYTFVIAGNEQLAMHLASQKHFPDTQLHLDEETDINGTLVFSVTTEQAPF